jgi:hypothetical protein
MEVAVGGIEDSVQVRLRHLIERKSLFLVVAVRETFRYQTFAVRADLPEAGARVIDVECPACGGELLLVVDSAELLRAKRRTRFLTALVAAAVSVLSVALTFGIEYVDGPVPLSSPLGVALLLGFLLGALVAGAAGYAWWHYRGVRLSVGVGTTDGVHTVEGLLPLRGGNA